MIKSKHVFEWLMTSTRAPETETEADDEEEKRIINWTTRLITGIANSDTKSVIYIF